VRIADEATRAVVKQAYFDRLIRMDIGATVGDSLRRHDPATNRLYDAVAAFLESVPASVLAGSDVLVEHVIVPPARRWTDLVPSARPSYWTMVRAAFRRGVPMRPRGRWQQVAWPAFVLVRRSDARSSTAAASVIVSVVGGVTDRRPPPTTVRRRVSRRARALKARAITIDAVPASRSEATCPRRVECHR
jgi:hypothetical protein